MGLENMKFVFLILGFISCFTVAFLMCWDGQKSEGKPISTAEKIRLVGQAGAAVRIARDSDSEAAISLSGRLVLLQANLTARDFETNNSADEFNLLDETTRELVQELSKDEALRQQISRDSILKPIYDQQ